MLQETQNGASARNDSPIAPIIGAIVDDVLGMLRLEVTLAKTEVKEELAKSADSVVLVGLSYGFGTAAVLLGNFGLLELAKSFFPTIPLAVDYFAIGGIDALLALLLFKKAGEGFRKLRVLPTQTIESLKENVVWAKKKLKI